MTSTQNVVAIFRTGILNDNIGPIAKATFEVQTDEFLKAARHGELDSMRGVSANVMCGQTGFYGTHAFNVIVDFKRFKNVSYSEISKENEETWNNQLKRKVSQLDKCSDMQEIENSISQVKPNNTTSCGFMKDGYEMDF
jgi:DNA-directed RNA polymerase II subunit RPB1